jgi:hypothetical protein
MSAVVAVVTAAALHNCAKTSLSARHYRSDGACRCDDRVAALDDVEQARAQLRAARERMRAANQRLAAT